MRVVGEGLRELMGGVKLCREVELTRTMLLEFLASQGEIEEVRVEVTVQTMAGVFYTSQSTHNDINIIYTFSRVGGGRKDGCVKRDSELLLTYAELSDGSRKGFHRGWRDNPQIWD